MGYKFCLKCLDYQIGREFCPSCGSKLVNWDLACECGFRIPPTFSFSLIPGRKVPYYKFCPGCGLRVDKLMKSYLKQLKAMMAEGKVM